jgi:hypothetical protein
LGAVPDLLAAFLPAPPLLEPDFLVCFLSDTRPTRAPKSARGRWRRTQRRRDRSRQSQAIRTARPDSIRQKAHRRKSGSKRDQLPRQRRMQSD